MIKKIMILGASILQVPAIEKALEMGLDVIAVDMNPDAIGFSIRGVKKAVISTIDTYAVLQEARKNSIDGIMTLASDMPMQTVAVVSKALNLVGISEETALKATNKAYMRDALRNYGVPIPEYYRAREKKDFVEAVQCIRKNGLKCIIKPADNSGSRGVFLLDENDELDKVFDYSRSFSRGGEIIVEEYMDGPEVSVETLAIQGQVHVIQITDKLTTGAPYFVEMGHNQPSQLDYSTQMAIAKVAVDANHAIGIANGPSHTEIKVTNSGPKIVELGARLGGDCITTHLVPLSTGVNMVEASIRIALGEKPNIKKMWEKGAAIRYFTSTPGMIKEINGIEEAEKVPGVKQLSVVHKVGEYVHSIRSSVDRVGFVIAQGDDASDAVKRAEMANSLIKVVTI